MLSSKTKTICLVSFGIAVIIIVSLILINSISNRTDKVVALVNSEPILQSQLDMVLQQDKSIDRTELLENTIDDILLMQYAKNNGCSVSKQEVDELIREYKETYSVFYEEALKIYTEDELRAGLENRILIDKGKQVYFSKFPIDTEKGFEDYLKSYDIEITSLTEEQIDTAKQKYKEKLEETAMNNFVKELRKESNIEYK